MEEENKKIEVDSNIIKKIEAKQKKHFLNIHNVYGFLKDEGGEKINIDVALVDVFTDYLEKGYYDWLKKKYDIFFNKGNPNIRKIKLLMRQKGYKKTDF